MTAASTYGRQVVIPLTNKSGGGVIAGDVVIVDTTNNDSFTLTTSANSTAIVGVAQETIANNAVGRICFSGYVSLVNVNASVTRGNFGATFTVAKQATDIGATRISGAFCQFLIGGTTPDAVLFTTSAGAVSPLTTKGDLWGFSTVDARVAVGLNGYVLTADSTATPGVAWKAATGGGGSGSGGLVPLEQHTASASATLDFTSFISSTYDTYFFTFTSLVMATNSVNLWLRMGTGGGPTYDTGANYSYDLAVMRFGGTGLGGGTGQTKITLDYSSSDSIQNALAAFAGVQGLMYLYDPQNTTLYKQVDGYVDYLDAASFRVRNVFRGGYESATALTALRFQASSGNITSGTIRAYGVAKS